MKGKLLSELPLNEVITLMAQGKAVVLPIGGGVKEHGSHLPLGTDMIVVQELAQIVARDSDVLMLPPLNYGYFPAFVNWPGSVSIGAVTFMNFVADIIRSLVRHGARKFLILDGGVSTHFPLTIMSSDLHNELGIDVAVTDVRGLGAETAREVCESSKGGHADEAETSCILCLRPDLVRLEVAHEDYSADPYRTSGPTGIHKITLRSRMTTISGINGDPTRATAEKGRKILDAMGRDIVDFLTSFTREEHA